LSACGVNWISRRATNAGRGDEPLCRFESCQALHIGRKK